MRHQDRLSPRVSADGSPDGSARLPAWVDAGVDLAIGRDQRLRPRLLSILVAAGVYFLSLLAQWNVVSLGLADRDAAIGLMAFIVIGVATVYVAVRCGLTRRFAEPALVTPQMVFALVSIACAYHINPHVRAVLPMLAALVIMFGAFSLKPRNCLRFGAFAVVVFGITMAASVWRRPDIFEPSIEAHHFLFTAAVLLTMAFLAGQFSQLRANWRRQKRALQDAMDRLDAGQRAMAQAKAVAEAASLAKTRFLANMSHELRTPLNAVIGAAQLLRDERSDARQQEHLIDAIQRSGANLLGLIENVLDLSRIEAGRMRLRAADFHLAECIEAGLASAGIAAQAKRLRLACIIDPALPAWRHGDPDRLRQVVINLLGNAVKFTSSGEVVLRVRPGTMPDGVHISVTDTGVGIDAAALPYIFEPFRQANDAAIRRFGGSGLGLTIVHQLVEAMGGHVHVTSAFGQGSCFEFEIVLPPGANPPADPLPLACRVAIHDPHDASAQALQSLLQRMGGEVQRCVNAAQVCKWLAGTGPAQQAWLALAAEAPQREAVLAAASASMASARVIILADEFATEPTSAATPQRRHLVRPITRAALFSCMGAERDTAPGAPHEPRGLSAAAGPHHCAQVLVVEDDELNRNIVCRLLHNAGCHVSAAADGRQALQTFAQLERVDLVFMDWQMPDMDGLEVTRHLRAGAAGEAGRRVPIVALTANAFAEDREACLAAGMNDFLTKPVQTTLLMGMVTRWTCPEIARPASANPPERTTEQARPAAFDPSVLAALPMVADGSAPEYAQELLELFLHSKAQTLERIARALAAHESSELQRLVHTLKSGSAAIGALELSSLAAACEARLRQGQSPPPGLAEQLAGAFARLDHAAGVARPMYTEQEGST